MDKQQAMQAFYQGFGLPAYEESDVPDDADLKTGYITYQKMEGEFEEPVFPSCSLWHRNPSWKMLESVKNNINDTLKNGGLIIPIESGRVWIQRGSPFAQTVSEDDNSIRRYLINLAVEFLTE